MDRKKLNMPYTQRSAHGQGWEDAKAGKKNNNPYIPKTISWEQYDQGFHAFLADTFRGQRPLVK